MTQDAITILLTCLSYERDASLIERLARVSGEEYRQVVELAQRHNIASLLYHRLRHLNVTLPDDLIEALKQERQKDTWRSMHLYQELNKLLQLFQKLGITVIVLKGAYLAEAVYEQIGLRTMRDIDLLIRKEDLQRVDQELLALGCAPEELNRVITPENHHFGYTLPGSGHSVEIHWTLLESGFPLKIDVEGLWNRARPVTMAQASAFVFSPEDLLLHLCLHTLYHAYKTMLVSYEMRVRMLCDIGEVVRHFGAKLDWQVMGERARQWGAVRALYVILRLVQDLLNVAVPTDWLASLRPENFNERYLDLTREQILAKQDDAQTSMLESNYLARLSGSTGLGSKLALIRNRLLPAREAIALKYPASATSWRIYLYYPVRWLELLVHYGDAFWHLARGDPKTRSIAERANQIMELRDWLMSG